MKSSRTCLTNRNSRSLAHTDAISSEWRSTEARQFDFWIGSWDVNLRAIQPDNTWKETIKAHARVYPILDGKAILELWDSPTIKGFSLRHYAPEKKKWVLHLDWPNEKESSFSSLEGSFRHCRGEFFASEKNKISRYTFCDITPESLRWDDAYSKDGGKTWTFDWIMEFSRTEAKPDWPSTTEALTSENAGSRRKGNEEEFAMIGALAGNWTGEIEVINADSRARVSAKMSVYKILDGCAVIQFLEYELDEKTHRNFSMLTYNAVAKRFEELSLDNRVGTAAEVRHGAIAGGVLELQAPESTAEKSSMTKTVWTLPSEGGKTVHIKSFASNDEKNWTQTMTLSLEPSKQNVDSMQLSDAINKTCPRSGKPIVASSLTEYRGFTVGFCNQHCRDDFAGNVADRDSDRAFFDGIILKLGE